MSAPPRTPEALLRRLEWTMIRRLDGLLHGSYRTLFRGAGLDLAELREYQLHDDVRHIDWNVTARLDVPHVRQFLEDRDVFAWFLLDLSPSVDFGSAASKRDVLVGFVTVLTRVLTRHGNPVGAMFYGDGFKGVIPPRTGRRHVLHLLDSLINHPVLPRAPTTDLGSLIGTAMQMIRRRSLVFLVSDFISTPGWIKPLAELGRRHETIAIRLTDPAEIELPRLGLTVVEDAETGEQMFVDTESKSLRARFAGIAQRREEEIRGAFANFGIDALELATDDDLMDSLLRFAVLRKRRVTTSGVLAGRMEARA
jgi:uncharacterized protein (DUF58 family)